MNRIIIIALVILSLFYFNKQSYALGSHSKNIKKHFLTKPKQNLEIIDPYGIIPLLEEGEYIIPDAILDRCAKLVGKEKTSEINASFINVNYFDTEAKLAKFKKVLREELGLKRRAANRYINALTTVGNIIIRESGLKKYSIIDTLPHERMHREINKLSFEDKNKLAKVARKLLRRSTDEGALVRKKDPQAGSGMTYKWEAIKNWEELYTYLAGGVFDEQAEEVLKEEFPEEYAIYKNIKQKTHDSLEESFYMQNRKWFVSKPLTTIKSLDPHDLLPFLDEGEFIIPDIIMNIYAGCYNDCVKSGMCSLKSVKGGCIEKNQLDTEEELSWFRRGMGDIGYPENTANRYIEVLSTEGNIIIRESYLEQKELFVEFLAQERMIGEILTLPKSTKERLREVSDNLYRDNQIELNRPDYRYRYLLIVKAAWPKFYAYLAKGVFKDTANKILQENYPDVYDLYLDIKARAFDALYNEVGLEPNTYLTC